ncbi:MAG: dienelactone hydrolase family protein [Pseudomonadales bacterium]|nr:dienelactone hydrolase family protein [Pseudomonadales bacterium]MDG1442970.1 dienelactone hydrolase family protein [Pseudomonadales bacterium]
MLKKLSFGLLVTTLVLVVAIVIGVQFTAPQQPARDSPSAKWLAEGPYQPQQAEMLFVDSSRATDANGEFAGAPHRSLPSAIWYPKNAGGPYPLIVYSHGFTSSRDETKYLLAQLASHGYVVLAANYPLTSGAAPGGANANDVSNQPEDITFLIDSVLALSDSDKPFEGEIDSNRIGLMGLSLGGLTTSLTSYHPRLREPRVKAAVSIAGPSEFLSKKFYDQSGVTIPFLMIAGSADRLILHNSNAAVIPERVTNGSLLTIVGGNHIGFVNMAEPVLRFFHNSDFIACAAVLASVDPETDEVFTDLLSEADGIVADPNAPKLCAEPKPPASGHPGRQHMITQIGMLSFFESVFGNSLETRSEGKAVLQRHLAEDFDEANFQLADRVAGVK